jgi:hypothetical protein
VHNTYTVLQSSWVVIAEIRSYNIKTKHTKTFSQEYETNSDVVIKLSCRALGFSQQKYNPSILTTHQKEKNFYLKNKSFLKISYIYTYILSVATILQYAINGALSGTI